MKECSTSKDARDTSAFSERPDDWHQINWPHVYRNVRGMQVRIAKAAREQNWRKVRALQRKLTRSFCGKALAVRRVTENQGKRSPGVDGQLWTTPKAKREAIDQLNRKGYKPLPLRRVYIPKANGKKRALGIPTMRDRAMQALHLLALAPVAESKADLNSYGFRIGRSTADAICQCHQTFSKPGSAQWVLEADIEGCFDHIDHSWLIDHIPMDKVVLRKWLKAGVVDLGTLKATEAGTPQGGIISPTLANLALDGLEPLLADHFGGKGSKKNRKHKVYMVRYADDFVISGSSKELLESKVRPMVEQFLAERGLKLSPAKTHVTSIHDGFDFLGWNARKYGGKLLIKPSKDNVKAFMEKVRTVIKTNPSANQSSLIWQLNPIIRGWVNYHKHQVASDAFGRADAQLFNALWRWAKRRHPKKGRRWIAKKYWQHIDNRNWTFAETLRTEADEAKVVKLIYLSDTPIKRHVKVKADFNPFDPEYESYGEQRLQARMSDKLHYRKQVNALFQSQNGKCMLCHAAITWDTGWHDHHIIHRVHGGNNALSNRVLLHPTCHNQLHSQNLMVTKPASQEVS